MLSNSAHAAPPDDIIRDTIKAKNVYISKAQMGPIVILGSKPSKAVSWLYIIK